jgi:hypothetical protein
MQTFTIDSGAIDLTQVGSETLYHYGATCEQLQALGLTFEDAKAFAGFIGRVARAFTRDACIAPLDAGQLARIDQKELLQ